MIRWWTKAGLSDGLIITIRGGTSCPELLRKGGMKGYLTADIRLAAMVSCAVLRVRGRRMLLALMLLHRCGKLGVKCPSFIRN